MVGNVGMDICEFFIVERVENAYAGKKIFREVGTGKCILDKFMNLLSSRMERVIGVEMRTKSILKVRDLTCNTLLLMVLLQDLQILRSRFGIIKLVMFLPLDAGKDRHSGKTIPFSPLSKVGTVRWIRFPRDETHEVVESDENLKLLIPLWVVFFPFIKLRSLVVCSNMVWCGRQVRRWRGLRHIGG